MPPGLNSWIRGYFISPSLVLQTKELTPRTKKFNLAFRRKSGSSEIFLTFGQKNLIVYIFYMLYLGKYHANRCVFQKTPGIFKVNLGFESFKSELKYHGQKNHSSILEVRGNRNMKIEISNVNDFTEICDYLGNEVHLINDGH